MTGPRTAHLMEIKVMYSAAKRFLQTVAVSSALLTVQPAWAAQPATTKPAKAGADAKSKDKAAQQSLGVKAVSGKNDPKQSGDAKAIPVQGADKWIAAG